MNNRKNFFKNICLAVFLIVSLLPNTKFTKMAIAQTDDFSLIGIQAGHWKDNVKTGATSSCDGTTEVSLNLQLANKIANSLQAKGYQAVVLSAEGTYVNGVRTSWSRDGYDKNDFALFLSIHSDNATQCSSTAPKGFKVAGPSKDFVDNIWAEYEKATRFSTDRIHINENMTSYYAFNYLDTKTIKGILELGWLSNLNELSFIKSELGQSKIVDSVVTSIERSLDESLSQGVTLYENSNYGGRSIKLTQSDDDLCDDIISGEPVDPKNACHTSGVLTWNDNISSIKLSPGYSAILLLHSRQTDIDQYGQHQARFACNQSIPDLSQLKFDGTSISLNDNISAIVIAKCTGNGSSTLRLNSLGEFDPCSITLPTKPTDQSVFVSDLTLPDGTLASPSLSLTKIWRLRNSGISSWGNGYKLVFVSGEQMGAPGETEVPTTAPNQTVDLSVPITAPTTSGEHTGYFQLRNPQGTYFGPKIWVKINVRSASSKITVLSADPSSPADAQTVRVSAKVEGMTNLRAMRLKVDGQVQGEFAGPEYTFTWNTNGFSAGAHSVTIEAADLTDTSWSHPEVRSISYILLGTTASPNLKPNTPTLTSPYDWFVYYSGNTAQLCAQANGDPDGDAISAYYFDVYDSAQLWNSGWTASNCVTTGTLGPYNYKWHVKVRDSRGAESDWSADRNFTLVNPNLSITDLSFQPQDGNSEVVKIRACTAGQAGIGITMRVDVNDAIDGSANGEWHRIKELSVPCFSDADAPIWQTLEAGGHYGDGPHLVRVEAHGLNTGWNGAAVREAVYTLPHRRPSGFSLIAPVSSSGNLQDPVFLASPTVTFQWDSALRANSYTLSVGVNPNPSGDASPVYRQTFTAGVTQQTVTFGQNYPVLYWQVRATNDMGSTDTGGQLIGIDQTEPTCSIQSLPSVSYENNFQVNWTGADTPAGIRAYDIQYLDSERGSWNDWLTAAPNSKTYELFSGQAGHSYSFRCRAVDNAGNVGSYPTSGITTIKVDPAGRPPEPWWGSDYATKRSITIQNNMASVALPTDYPVKVYFTSGTTPSAADVYNASISAKKCDDLRIVYNNSTELNRYIKKCAPDGIEIWFRTKASIATGSTDVAYQMYLGNPGAVDPPEDPAQIWYPYREGDATNLYLFQEGSGSTAMDYSGNGRNCSINSSVQWSAGKWGSGLYFNRANNGGTISLTCGSPYPIYSLTAEMWFKSDSSFYNSDGRIAGQLGPNGQLSWLFSVESSKLKFERWCNGGSQQARGNIDLHREPYLSQWNHIAVTFDGGSQVKFYVNGNLDTAVTLGNSCSATYNVPLEIGSVEGSGQGQYTIGAFKLSNTVKTNFSPSSFANITNEPTTAVGLVILPPATGSADLAVESLISYPNPSGGILVEAVVKNNGTTSTVNGFYTDLYLDHLPTGSNDFDGSLKFWVNDPIPAGGTATLTTAISDFSQLGLTAILPGEEKSGMLYAQTDSTGALNEPNKENNIYSGGVEVCTAAGDIYEDNDDVSSGATWLTGVQTHNFDQPADEDWVKLAVKEGQVYRIFTSNLGANADTYIYLFDQDGMTLLASNDDSGGSLASLIEWVAPADGIYYILIKQWNPSAGGCGTSYSIRLEGGVEGNNIYLPIIIR